MKEEVKSGVGGLQYSILRLQEKAQNLMKKINNWLIGKLIGKVFIFIFQVSK